MNKQVVPRDVRNPFSKNLVQVIRCKNCIFKKEVNQPGWVKCELTGRLMSVLGYCSEAMYDNEVKMERRCPSLVQSLFPESDLVHVAASGSD